MADKLNSEFNYRYQVEGETIWAKIKTLNGFLCGRERAAVLEKVSKKKYEAKLAKLEYLKREKKEKYKILELEAEIIETESFLEEQKEIFILNHKEIVVLEKLLAEAYAVAEPSRIKGYTDDDMYEANAANEFTVNIARDIQSEIIAQGQPSPAKIRNAMSNPHTLRACQGAGLIPVEAKIICGHDDPIKQIEIIVKE